MKRTQTYNTGQYHNIADDGAPKPWAKLPTGNMADGSGNTAGSAGMPVAPGGEGIEGAGEASEAMQWLTGIFGGGRTKPEIQTIDVNTGNQTPVTTKPNNTIWWVVGGVSVVAFIGVVVWAVAGKKGK